MCLFDTWFGALDIGDCDDGAILELNMQNQKG